MADCSAMSRRNLIWLAAIVVAGVVVGVIAGWIWGIVAAVVVLVGSESVERQRRRKRGGTSPLRGAVAKKRGSR